LYINPGFQVLHDTSLGEESFLIGPENILDLIVYRGSYQNNHIGLNFSKAVLIDEPIQLRTNLNKHNVGNLKMRFYFVGEKRNYENFLCNGPIEGENITFHNDLRTKQPIQLQAKSVNFHLDTCTDCEFPIPPVALVGQVDQITLPKDLHRLKMDDLLTQKYVIHHESMQGRKLSYVGIPALELVYDSESSYNLNGDEITLIPDTVMVSSGTVVSAYSRNGRDVTKFNEVVVIEEAP
ncbi:MAG: hypothetical protein AAF705_22190, partial [Bacteroidota bacterium]